MGNFNCFGMLRFKKPRIIGSPGLYLKNFKNTSENQTSYSIDSKCNFEKTASALILHSNKLNKHSTLCLKFVDLIELELIKGKEYIRPFPLSVMWWLLKCGISIRYARYFKSKIDHYVIENMELSVKTTAYQFQFEANGYLFDEFIEYFKKMDLIAKLKIEERQ